MWGPRQAGRCFAASMLSLAGISTTLAYTLDPNSRDSIKSISKQIARDMIDNYYVGNLPGNEPGLVHLPHYWWQGGALMGTLISYWHFTGDDQFNNMTTAGMLAQVGEQNDFMPKSQILSEGNDDQGFWGLAAMAAAESRFPDPPKDKPQWLALAQAVFNTQAARWETGHCGGGLRWQVYDWNKGYDYKNTISGGCFFNIAARLALYTGNATYAQWAEKTWDWLWAVNFIDHNSHWVYDGAGMAENCTKIVDYVWTYNSGVLMHGLAAMYNHTTGSQRQMWEGRLERMVNASKVFFNGTNKDIMSEVACEPVGLCNVDQMSFKAYLSRWMAGTTKWAPQTASFLMPLLRTSAVAAARQCTGGPSGRLCGLRWIDDGANDGSFGLGQMMSALEVVTGLLASDAADPVTDTTGGTSQGDPEAGGSDVGRVDFYNLPPIGQADQAGAYVLTVAGILGLVVAIVFMLMDENDGKTWAERGSDLREYVVHGGSGGAAAVVGGILRKNAPTTEEKGKAMVGASSVQSSDSNWEPQKAGGGRVVIMDPNTGRPMRDSDEEAPRLPPAARAAMHRSTKSESALDPELGLAGAGFRKSATKQLEENSGASTPTAKRNSLKKPRPTSMAA